MKEEISYPLQVFMSKYDCYTAGFYKEVCNEIKILVRNNIILETIIKDIRNEVKGNVISFDGKNYNPSKNLTKQEVYKSYTNVQKLLKANYIFLDNDKFLEKLKEGDKNV